MTTNLKDRNLIAILGDEDSVTGMLLTGIGDVNINNNANFKVIDSKTPVSDIKDTFEEFTQRKDIAIILINQWIAELIRETMDGYTQTFPTVLEIPSKDLPYDPNKDSVLKRVQRLFKD
ncbi:V-type proton ATPase subunit F [Smittium culicis]|uniref:V-type proton ATPase subunit F n=1 Tax=Smittium culicis TaxID=133412 RepID=A0A1R1YU92_9FUNG|nr:V-type proton ATPase subunit F [Smittium culicis]